MSIRHFLEYEPIAENTVIQEGVDEKVITDSGGTRDDYIIFLKNFFWMILFYVMFLFLFFVGGSIMLKYVILCRAQAYPISFDYRDKTKPNTYNKFFGVEKGKEEKLKNAFFPSKTIEIIYEDEDNKKTNIFFPIFLNYNKYYEDYFYNIRQDTSPPADGAKKVVLRTYDDDKRDIKSDAPESFQIKESPTSKWGHIGFYMSMIAYSNISLNYCLFNIFSTISPIAILFLVFLFCISGVSSAIEDILNKTYQKNTSLTTKILVPILTCSGIPLLWLLGIFCVLFQSVANIPQFFLCNTTTTTALQDTYGLPDNVTHENWNYETTMKYYTLAFMPFVGGILNGRFGKGDGTSAGSFFTSLWYVFFGIIICGGISFGIRVGLFIFIGLCYLLYGIICLMGKILWNTFQTDGCFKFDDQWHHLNFLNTMRYILPIFFFTYCTNKWLFLILFFVLFLSPLIIISFLIQKELGVFVIISLFVVLFLKRSTLFELHRTYINALKAGYDFYKNTTKDDKLEDGSSSDPKSKSNPNNTCDDLEKNLPYMQPNQALGSGKLLDQQMADLRKTKEIFKANDKSQGTPSFALFGMGTNP